MGTLVGVNKYAIKMRKSKPWTGLYSCPLISFITEILLLNNISVNNLSSVFRSARVNNSIEGGGSLLSSGGLGLLWGCPRPPWMCLAEEVGSSGGLGKWHGYGAGMGASSSAAAGGVVPIPVLSGDGARSARAPKAAPFLQGSLSPSSWMSPVTIRREVGAGHAVSHRLLLGLLPHPHVSPSGSVRASLTQLPTACPDLVHMGKLRHGVGWAFTH